MRIPRRVLALALLVAGPIAPWALGAYVARLSGDLMVGLNVALAVLGAGLVLGGMSGKLWK